MTPAQKRAAGRTAVAYVRVSSKGQRDNWSLDQQEQVVRSWCEHHGIPLRALVRAPAGWESGKDFESRVGWQEVEEHLASGQVGWLVAAAVDRLSRNLLELARKAQEWDERDIAVIIPSLSGDTLTGVPRLFIHLLGTMAEQERRQLLRRVTIGMQARLNAGLPLGRQPLGYNIISDAAPQRGKPRQQVVPDPETAPIVTALFALAIARPELGDRRVAALAAARWPQLHWSPGRIASVLTNRIYTGRLAGTLHQSTVLHLENHPPLVSAAEFERVQALRAERAADREAGFDAVSADSWLGGIARCARCGAKVLWRNSGEIPFSKRIPGLPHDPGLYECRGGGSQGPRSGCGLTWRPQIESFVWRAVEHTLERERGLLQRITTQAIDQIPALLDERRRRLADTVAAVDVEETHLTQSLVGGELDADRYASAIERLRAARASAQAQLSETDGWTYLARLLHQQEGPGAHRWRWITLQEALLPTHVSADEVRRSLAVRRRILRAIAPEIILHDPSQVGSLDGPGEDHVRGIYTGVTFTRTTPTAGVSPIATALARLLVHSPGHDVAAGLEAAGWTSAPEVATETGAAQAWVSATDEATALLMLQHPLEPPVPLPSPSTGAVSPPMLRTPGPIRLWLDDCRPKPADYTHLATTAAAAIALLETGQVVSISLDHDLGDEAVVGSGYQVACHIEQAAHAGTLVPITWAIHSANPVGRKRMEAALRSAERAWAASSDVRTPDSTDDDASEPPQHTREV